MLMISYKPRLRLTQGSVDALGFSGAEDLRPSLQSCLKPFPHRTSKELHFYSASFRFDIVLLPPFNCHHSTAAPSPEYSLVFFAFSVYSGPPDPIHGTALYQKVRNTAQVRHRLYLSMMSIICVWQLGKTTFCLLAGSGQVTFHR